MTSPFSTQHANATLTDRCRESAAKKKVWDAGVNQALLDQLVTNVDRATSGSLIAQVRKNIHKNLTLIP